jgi:hypothetical protein
MCKNTKWTKYIRKNHFHLPKAGYACGKVCCKQRLIKILLASVSALIIDSAVEAKTDD